MEITCQSVQSALTRHVGREAGVTARELVVEICGAWSAGAERELREVVVELRTQGIAVCAHPASGYFIARDQAELQLCINFLVERIRTTAGQVRQLQRLAKPDLHGQRRLML
jgi:hypothetical protein